MGVRAPLRLHVAPKRQSVVGLGEREVYEITALQSVVRHPARRVCFCAWHARVCMMVLHGGAARTVSSLVGVPCGCAAANQADESAVWKITRQVSHSLKQFLTKGSIIRLIHTEKEAHLTAMHGDIDARVEPGGSRDMVFLRDYDG